MRIRISYNYKVYPGLDKFTRKSRWIGWATGAPGKILLGMFYLIIAANIFNDLGWNNGWLISFVLFTTVMVPGWVLNPLKEKWYGSLDRKYVEALRQLEATEPDKYYDILRELNRK